MDALPAQFRGDAVIDEICLHRAGKKPFACSGVCSFIQRWMKK